MCQHGNSVVVDVVVVDVIVVEVIVVEVIVVDVHGGSFWKRPDVT